MAKRSGAPRPRTKRHAVRRPHALAPDSWRAPAEAALGGWSRPPAGSADAAVLLDQDLLLIGRLLGPDRFRGSTHVGPAWWSAPRGSSDLVRQVFHRQRALSRMPKGNHGHQPSGLLNLIDDDDRPRISRRRSGPESSEKAGPILGCSASTSTLARISSTTCRAAVGLFRAMKSRIPINRSSPEADHCTKAHPA